MKRLLNMFNLLNKDYRELLIKSNSLELDNEILKETIKDELYKEFMKKLSEPSEIKKYKEENKRLRKRIKFYKEELKNDKKV